ncbi:hypothetical protein ES703_06143 [subsurface metagenome]
MDGIIEALKQVPEVRLRIIKLAWQVTGEDGSMDAGQMLFHIKELEESVSEAQAYSSATREAARCLREMDRS